MSKGLCLFLNNIDVHAQVCPEIISAAACKCLSASRFHGGRMCQAVWFCAAMRKIKG